MDINQAIIDHAALPKSQRISDLELANRLGLTREAVQSRRGRLRGRGLIPPHDPSDNTEIDEVEIEKPAEAIAATKTGVEARMNDQITINWSTKTVITHLGEFGDYVCNFDLHGAIQRAYVDAYEGKGQTSAEVATRFEFAHAKAVLKYAKLHGFTKSSVPQTDIEFEEGLDPETAAAETLQSLKRRTLRITERKKWDKVQRDADKWNSFEQSVLMPTRDWIETSLPTRKARVLKLGRVQQEEFAVVVGISDWHYMKLCYDKDWNEVYNREKAIEVFQEAAKSLLEKALLHGRPEKIFIPLGNDNLHIDNPNQTTTRGTEQASSTVGDWAGELQTYVDTNVELIEMYAQIAPVEVVCINGNHDDHTSEMLSVLLSTMFAKHDRVNVSRSHYPRQYFQYGDSCIGFAHGSDQSLNKLKVSLHKFVLMEAGEFGVNTNKCGNYLFFTGHLHYDAFEDLGGVKHFIIPSMSGTDDWHRAAGFVGSRKESAIYLVNKKGGRFAVHYT